MRKHLVIAALAIATALAGHSQAKAQTSTPAISSQEATQDLSARRGHHHSRRHRRTRHGACDGFHGCRCGVTAARRHGLPLNYQGHNLKEAVEYKRAFPAISMPIPGAVVYQTGGGPTGHVSTIEQVLGRCDAVVSDDRGAPYRRNICGRNAVILQVSG